MRMNEERKNLTKRKIESKKRQNFNGKTQLKKDVKKKISMKLKVKKVR